MSEHLLHRAEIRAALAEMGREGVAQRVRRHPLGEARLADVMTKNLPGADSR